MPLFAIMDNESAIKIVRIKLDKDASEMIDQTFGDQKLHFEAHHDSVIPFYAGYSPSYNECFELDNFADAESLADTITRNTAIPEWDPKEIDIDHIKALFVGVGKPKSKDCIAIQTFNKKQILDTSKSFVMSIVGAANTFSKAEKVGFNIDDKLVAIIKNGKIYFRSFFKLRSIFNMNVYFQEATDNDLAVFSSNTAFIVPPGFDLSVIADTPIRNKITMINKSGILEAELLPTLKAAANKIGFPLKTQVTQGQEKIEMPQTKKEIKALLDFLDEDIFTSEISQKIFKSNSKRPYN
ncbi:Kiwa anti-phage protein KwaB-like domain-containing protein [Cedecea lapagei]|uniref:Kiwa anti-phage protein KwaB-like domain-containing protein n=1 Tax=Cedecea lapagei TaxID=158823 RepID=UPI001BCFA876|nr:Kiwa anti-phage protein KwaB-like domain-containing protein [Cedecea lapagei]